MANDSLASGVFSQNTSRALNVTNSLEAGLFSYVLPCAHLALYNSCIDAQINNSGWVETEMLFGGYQTSGWHRDLGEYALKKYAQFLCSFVVACRSLFVSFLTASYSQ
jgi:acyl-CoA reductase-like NAD-dependent aldehyde dehydrogenase